MKTMYFASIPAVPRRDMVLLRLGYKKSAAVVSPEQQVFLEKALNRGQALCKPEGILARCGITEHTEEYIRLESGQYLYGKRLARLMQHSDEALLMAATVGCEVVDASRKEIIQGDAALCVVLDAVASQTTDAAIDWMLDFAGRLVLREGKRTTKNRCSPGHGDFELSNQRMLYDLLELNKLGLHLTEKQMLMPEKSTIALAGILTD